MKQIPITLTLLMGVLLFQSARADLLRSEQFVGYETGTLGGDATTGTVNGWNLSTDEITLTSGSESLIGTNLGLVASAGDRAFISAIGTNASGEVIGARNQFVPNSTFPTGSAAVETNVYYSFLYKFNNAADVSTAGEYIIQVNRANSGILTPQHWNIVARNVGGQIQLGIAKAGAPNNTTNFATAHIAPGETIFVVVRQHILPGGPNDVYDLWINPPAESFYADEANLPPPSASVGSEVTDGAEDTSNTGPGRFVVFAGANAEFDELRIATTWAEVTPFFSQCLPATVQFVSETDITQSAELSATFRVAAFGTSPTIQWQSSTDAGTTWNDIPFATVASYTTPNLELSDSGILYRAIVFVECDGSSATSAVASVTLTEPIVTEPGLIMHDTFIDPDLGFDDRSNPPLTISNSLWYTAVTDNLTAFGQGGNLLGIPVTGSSSLWLGYFTEEGAPPVHLAVGTAIKVTLPFIPNSFSAHTNNAGLRMGLFDYYDAGTRITADGANVGGSQGLGTGVRGYMLNLDFGPTFSANSPMQLLVRTFLPDNNLMGTVADYESLGSGPAGGGYEGAPAFQAGTEYTLEFTVARIGVNAVDVTASITGGGTNWTWSVTETNYAYHRFDAFGIRPNNLETSADSFTFPEFKVEVIEVAVPLLPFNISAIELLSPGTVKLTWDSMVGLNYHVLSTSSLTAPDWTTNATIQATGVSTSYTNSPGVDERFYRVLATP